MSPSPSSTQRSDSKKPRRFYRRPQEETVFQNTASANDLTVLHQSTHFSFVWSRNNNQNNTNKDTPHWKARGTTCLYVLNKNDSNGGGGTDSDSNTQPPKPPSQPCCFALHLRRTCRVRTVQVETIQINDAKTATSTQTDATAPGAPHYTLTTLSSSFTHDDPLAHVLVKPATSYAVGGDDDDDEDSSNSSSFDADAQSVRGATGMTNGLRAASIASRMGELRIVVACSSTSSTAAVVETDTSCGDGSLTASRTTASLQDSWMQELEQFSSSQRPQSRVTTELRTQLHQRSVPTRAARLAHVARQLANHQSCAYKLTIEFDLELTHAQHGQQQQHHFGGIHVQHGGSSTTSVQTPHIYTTCGVVGDHQGPSTYVPCCDSASAHHRASHEWCLQVTAPFQEGLSVLGCGEDLGVSRTLLHGSCTDVKYMDREDDVLDCVAIKEWLGSSHVDLMLHEEEEQQQQTSGVVAVSQDDDEVHVIPPDEVPLDSILATCTWVSQAWTPTAPRSFGFAIGPFKVLEDPEYFGEQDDEVEEAQVTAPGSMKSNRLDREAFLKAARKNGEGIRQAYFAPLFERKFLHAMADATLLPETEILLTPLSRRQKELSAQLDETVLYSTAGVPHRALACMRDVLALPAYRTASYTQIWIPDAVHGGSTSGALHWCPDVLINPFLGGAIMDSRLLPRPGYRLPFHSGGRVIQFLQARCALRGWITSALPLGGNDDVGMGYILTLIESFLMSLYERGHGAFGEGGAHGSVYFTRRYSAGSGLNSSNFDFLPVRNFEEGELDMVVGGGAVGAVPIEDRNNAQLWRDATNGTESHTSALDEFSVRQLLLRDCVEAIERGTDKDKQVPSPSMGWLGSHLSLSLLSTNASSSSDLGCGAVELAHPRGGLVYRTLKCEILRQVIEGRAGMANCIRLIRAAFIAAHMEDHAKKAVHMESKHRKGREKEGKASGGRTENGDPSSITVRPPFIVCVEEMLKNHGLTHTLFTRALRIIAGPAREAHLRGTLVDVERELRKGVSHRQFVEPEGFPNSYVRGAAGLYLRVGVHVEASDGGSSSAAGPVAVKGTQAHILAEPVIPDGGIAFGGPITLRVVENEGQLREFVRTLNSDGSRCEWGPIFLHAKPVTTAKQQTAASGVIEASESSTLAKEQGSNTASQKHGGKDRVMSRSLADRIFTANILHGGGYQAIELVRLTNLTPLLWVRVDPMGMYAGRISIVQPDPCLAEQLFHDGSAMAQVEAIRALAERPLRLQASSKIKQVYDVDITELPVRVLGDCLRGSPALHSSLPHTPAVRVQAAFAIAQWQNNRAPATQEAVGSHAWTGLNLLIQYFRERYYSDGIIAPVTFTRLVVRSNEDNAASAPPDESGTGGHKGDEEDLYQYLDSIEDDMEKTTALHAADEVDIEEDEECRVRSAVVSAIACVRAQNGLTPRAVLDFLEAVLVSGDASMVGMLAATNEAVALAYTGSHEKNDDAARTSGGPSGLVDHRVASLSYNPSPIVADALLALCHVNASPPVITDLATGKTFQAKTKHPLLPLIDASRRWLEWELYRERIRNDIDSDAVFGLGGNTDSRVAACAITALSSLSILRQATTDPSAADFEKDSAPDSAVDTKFYVNIFDDIPRRADSTRAACAQAVSSISCGADRFEVDKVEPVGLLSALEFLLDRILDSGTSSGLRQTLAVLMLDTCTGKVCSMQRVGAIGGVGDLSVSAARFFTGPLGCSHGGENGSAMLTTVSEASYPAANAVNDGARRGLRLLSRAGHPREEHSDDVIVRVATFATALWRTINGDCTPPIASQDSRFEGSVATADGVCAYDAQLRVLLLSLWQWIWPNGCVAVLRVQAFAGTPRYRELGAGRVMQITAEEKEASMAEELTLTPIVSVVSHELDRQVWRGEMATQAYNYYKEDSASIIKDTTAPSEQGTGQPLPPIQRDNAFKHGGWVASAAQQRRALSLDGGHTVKRIRLTVKGSS